MVTEAVVGIDRRLLRAFADLLDYPRGPLEETIRECEALAADVPEAAAILERFGAFAAGAALGELQEAYTGAFDLDSLSDLEPTCYPYVGHHLFDENHKRSAFLVGLAGRYREYGFPVEGELPDHLVVVLRFLAACPDAVFAEELFREALVPALARMARAVPDDPRPGTASGRLLYTGLLRALLAVASPVPPSPAEAR